MAGELITAGTGGGNIHNMADIVEYVLLSFSRERRREARKYRVCYEGEGEGDEDDVEDEDDLVATKILDRLHPFQIIVPANNTLSNDHRQHTVLETKW